MIPLCSVIYSPACRKRSGSFHFQQAVLSLLMCCDCVDAWCQAQGRKIELVRIYLCCSVFSLMGPCHGGLQKKSNWGLKSMNWRQLRLLHARIISVTFQKQTFANGVTSASYRQVLCFIFNVDFHGIMSVDNNTIRVCLVPCQPRLHVHAILSATKQENEG